MRSDFCAFILSHGRADNIRTLKTLRHCGYTGPVIFLLDTDDKTVPQYTAKFGKDNVYIFDKAEEAKTFDECDNSGNRKTIVYARNACFRIAKELGFKYFIQLDDDYYYFGIRSPNGARRITKLDDTFTFLVEFLERSKIATVAFSQGGDHIGGYDPDKAISRKAMNSFVCCVDRPFKFMGRINEDVNTYVRLGSLGHVFLTIWNIQLDQTDTQKARQGMTDVYVDGGTYLKSFYSVIINPSCVRIKTVGIRHLRIHHSISWGNAVPKILAEKHRKP